jgi:hypothetical protein
VLTSNIHARPFAELKRPVVLDDTNLYAVVTYCMIFFLFIFSIFLLFCIVFTRGIRTRRGDNANLNEIN